MATPAEIRAVLSCWPVVGGDAADVGVEAGFSGALVRRVVTPPGTFALRGWPTGASGLPRERIVELHRWLVSLARAGITTVAVPLPTRNGSTLLELHGRLWQLEPWLPGTADFHLQPSDARLRAAFTELARWHCAAERYEPTTTGAPWFRCGRGVPPAVTERLEKLRVVGAAVRRESRPAEVAWRESRPAGRPAAVVERFNLRLQQLAPRIAAELSGCTSLNVPLHPCLRDVWHDHVLFDDDAVTGIIDPSAARTENVASDLSRLLGSLLGSAYDRWELALEAYALVRPLSADERRLVGVLDRSGVLLSAAHWHARMTRGPLSDREWERVLGIAERVEALAGAP